ncbi:hypothetical protein [Actinomadura alba]|uniref:Uncharacterized protein n=1 Tax=Actinomadura alba TaxID=406431 RepID=A0ABR7LUK3_9ACTN|nr:hypothetical protein [Actinomadura alba]MBC6468450.1 hypothetical protein [Actinomadura alba]
MRRTLVTVLSLAVVVVGLGAPASAAPAPIPTRFAEFSITPLISDIDHPRAFAGRLVQRGADGTDQALAGAVVALRENVNTLPKPILAQATTDADGRFTGTFAYGYSRPLFADYSPPKDSGYYYSLTDNVRVYSTPVESRISLAFTPRPAVVGDKVTLSGLVERKLPDGSWATLSNQPVRAFWVPRDTQSAQLITSTRSGADGRYQVTVATPGPSGAFRVDDFEDAQGPYTQATATTEWLTVRQTARLLSFDAGPEPVKKGRTLTVRGTLQRYDGAWRPLSGGLIRIYFRAKGTTTYKLMRNTGSASDGKWNLPFKADRDGYWYVAYPGDSKFLSVKSGSDYVDVR